MLRLEDCVEWLHQDETREEEEDERAEVASVEDNDGKKEESGEDATKVDNAEAGQAAQQKPSFSMSSSSYTSGSPATVEIYTIDSTLRARSISAAAGQ